MGNRLLRLRGCSRDWEGGLSGCDRTSGGQTTRATGREGPLRGPCAKRPQRAGYRGPMHTEDLQSRLPRPLRKEDLQSRLPRPHGASLSTILNHFYPPSEGPWNCWYHFKPFLTPFGGPLEFVVPFSTIFEPLRRGPGIFDTILNHVQPLSEGPWN